MRSLLHRECIRFGLKANDCMARNQKHVKSISYTAPAVFMATFYILLSLWTIVCVSFFYLKFDGISWPMSQWLVIVGIMIITWFFSSGIYYKISIDPEGNLELKSFRKAIRVSAEDIQVAEGPPFGVSAIGFLRLSMPQEKAFIFCLFRNEVFREVISVMKKTNPYIRFKWL